MFRIAATVLVLSIILVLYRVIKGPMVCDRVLGANVIGTKTVILVALIGYAFGRPHFLDIAIVYALINFIATIAFLKYRETGRLD